MVKKIKIIILSLLLFSFTIINVGAQNSYTIDVDSTYVTVLEVVDNKVKEIYNKNGDKKMYPASMTKLLSVYVAILNLNDFSQEVVIQSEDLKGLKQQRASVAGFKLNDKVIVKDLLYGALLPSGADATRVLARIVSGSEKDFVRLMNKTAQDLGMDSSNFKNTEGLHHKDHYSTTNDLSKLMIKAIRMPVLKEMISTMEYKTSNNKLKFKNSLQIYSENSLAEVGLILGGKTGWTPEAGFCLASYTKFNNKIIITISGNSPTYAGQVVDHNLIYNDLINNKHQIKVFDKDENLARVLINYSKDLKEFPLTTEEAISVEVAKIVSKDDLSIEVVFDDFKNAPVAKGEIMGKIKINYQDQSLYVNDILNKDYISKSNILYYQSVFIGWLAMSGHVPVLLFVLLLFSLFIVLKLVLILKRKNH